MTRGEDSINIDFCLCVKRTQIFSGQFILHTLNIYFTSSHLDCTYSDFVQNLTLFDTGTHICFA